MRLLTWKRLVPGKGAVLGVIGEGAALAGRARTYTRAGAPGGSSPDVRTGPRATPAEPQPGDGAPRLEPARLPARAGPPQARLLPAEDPRRAARGEASAGRRPGALPARRRPRDAPRGAPGLRERAGVRPGLRPLRGRRAPLL